MKTSHLLDNYSIWNIKHTESIIVSSHYLDKRNAFYMVKVLHMFVVLTDMLKKEKSHTIFSPKIMETCETLNLGVFHLRGLILSF